MAQQITEELDALSTALDQADDDRGISWRDFRERLRNLQKEINGTHFDTFDDRQVARNRAQSLYQRANEISDRYRRAGEDALSKAASSVQEAVNMLESDCESDDDWSRIQTLRRDAHTQLRLAGARLVRGATEEIWNRLRDVDSKCRSLEKAHDGCTKELVAEFEFSIARAQHGIVPWRNVYELQKLARAQLNRRRFSSRETRDGYWDTFNRANAELRQIESNRRYQSDKYKNDIVAHLPVLDSGILGLFELFADMATAGALSSSGDERIQDAKTRLRECRSMFNEHRSDMNRTDREEASRALGQAQAELDAYVTEHVKAKREARLDRARTKLVGKKEYCERLTDEVEQLERRISDTRLDIETAWSDGFRTRAEEKLGCLEGQLERKRAKQEAVSVEIENLEASIDEAES